MGKLSCSGWCSFDEVGLPGVHPSAGLAAQPGYGSAAVSTKAASASPSCIFLLVLSKQYSCFDPMLESVCLCLIVHVSNHSVSHRKELNDDFKVFVLSNGVYSHPSLR